MIFRLKIVDGTTTYTEWYLETPAAVVQATAQARWEHPDSAISVEYANGPPTSALPVAVAGLVIDPNPTLSADLQLAGHGIVGQLENQTLLLDGGLI